MAVSNIGTGGGGFQQSAGVNVREIDLTTVVPQVATTEGAIAGCFRWGPVEKIVLVDSENALVQKFGKPTSYNPETFFTAANFLAYGNQLFVSRAFDSTGHRNAIANTGSANVAAHTVKNSDHYLEVEDSFESDVHYIAKYPGELGSSLKISVCDTAGQYSSVVDIADGGTDYDFTGANTGFTVEVGSNTGRFFLDSAGTYGGGSATDFNNAATAVKEKFIVGDVVLVGDASIGRQYMKIQSISAITAESSGATYTGEGYFDVTFSEVYKLSTNYTTTSVARYWEFFNQTDAAPGTSQYVTDFGNTTATDEMHVVVVDEDGKFTGNPGTVLEVYKSLSRATDARATDGASNYYKDVINNVSAYVWVAAARTDAPTATATSIASSTATSPLTLSFVGGADGGSEDDGGIAFGDIARAWDLFQSTENADISLVVTGKARNSAQLANYLIDNIAEVRKDCVVFLSPPRSEVVNNSALEIAQDVVNFRVNNVRNSSFAVMDSGYKYQYDKYNDVYRYIPLNGDIAGLCARTDSIADPWFSPAGTNRGQIKNLVKLSFNPTKAERDLLYKNGVNPVVTFPGQGTILYGDKTLLTKPSAFDRINVRRLFIVLEKAIANAAKSTLFEFNDEFTRAQFKNLIEPFLRDIQGRRGIYDYRVVCDETNNPAEVIDTNRFVGDIYIKPARSINFIQLNFVAVRTGVEFTEVVGQF